MMHQIFLCHPRKEKPPSDMVIVMPMAGKGSRFAEAGYKTPKPLIEVNGVKMFVRAVESLPLKLATKIIFVILKDHVSEYSIDKEICARFGSLPIRLVVLDQVTSGQAETVALALKEEPDDQALLIFNADSAFDDDLGEQLASLGDKVDGAVQYFYDSDARWSFIKMDSDGIVSQCTEKIPVSRCASTGLYYFRRIRDFIACEKAAANIKGERYIAPLYNLLIEQNKLVVGLPVKKYFCFGTPGDLEEHLKGRYFTSILKE